MHLPRGLTWEIYGDHLVFTDSQKQHWTLNNQGELTGPHKFASPQTYNKQPITKFITPPQQVPAVGCG